MRKSRDFPTGLSLAVLLALAPSKAAGDPGAIEITAHQPGTAVGRRITRVECDGRACGGSGGASSSPFLYRIRPNGNRVDSFDVGVEDPDLSHYGGFVHPPNWEVSILTISSAHDPLPTEHGGPSGPAGSCPFVLRFSKGPGGATQTSAFELGFAYTLGEPGFHDAAWRTSDGSVSDWTRPLGARDGPVHSPFRLNVLMIVLDDVGTDMLDLYDELYEELDPITNSPSAGTVTPRLDALASEGIRFLEYYTNPLCSTTRACLMTGRYAFRHGVGGVMGAATPSCADPVPEPGEICVRLLDEELFLPELLRDGFTPGEGFRSGAFGKYHMSYWTPDADLPPVPGNESHAVDNGFDLFFGQMENVRDNATNDHYNWRRVRHDPLVGPPLVDFVSNRWGPTVVREDAVQWINAQTQPFFAYVNFNPPHMPLQVPPLELLSIPTQDALAACSPACGWPLLFSAMLESVDTEIGNLLDEIDAAKRANTMIFVVSDNGTPTTLIQPPHVAEHGKRSPYQLGVRVPMIVSGPLVPAAPQGGWRSTQLVNSVDLWRTVGAIAGADEQLAFLTQGIVPCPDEWIDSVSFLSLLQDPGQAGPGPRDWAFAQMFAPNVVASDLCEPITSHPLYDCLNIHPRAVTDGEFKLIRERSSKPCELPQNDEQFYWVGPIGRAGADVSETSDLLDVFDQLLPEAPAHAASALVQLRQRMDALSEF